MLRPQIRQAVGRCAYEPQRFDRKKNPYPPPIGAGVNVVVLNLLVGTLCWYVYSRAIIAQGAMLEHNYWMLIPLTISSVTLAVITASAGVAVLECFAKLPAREQNDGPDQTARKTRRRQWVEAFKAYTDGVIQGCQARTARVVGRRKAVLAIVGFLGVICLWVECIGA